MYVDLVVLVLAGGIVSLVGAVVYLAYRLTRNTPLTRFGAIVPIESPTNPSSLLEVVRTEKHCSLCVHFDLEEGQAIISSEARFAEVSRHLRPADMVEDRAYGDPLRVARKVAWDGFGLCLERQEGVYQGWTAEQRELALSVTREGGRRFVETTERVCEFCGKSKETIMIEAEMTDIVSFADLSCSERPSSDEDTFGHRLIERHVRFEAWSDCWKCAR